MKQFSAIFKFEFVNYLKNKIFIGTTIFLVVVLSALMFIPRFFVDDNPKTDNNQTETVDTQDTDKEVILLKFENTEIADYITSAFKNVFVEYNITKTDKDIEQIKEDIKSSNAECAFVIENNTSYTYYVNDYSLIDQKQAIVDSVMKNIYQVNEMVNNGIPLDKAQEIMQTQITSETVKLGVDQTNNYAYTYIMVFGIYMIIVMYGQLVAINVVSEKSSRAMELLVTSANSHSLMIGKILASCTAGLLQIIIILMGGLLSYNYNKSYFENIPLLNSLFPIPTEILVFMIVFFILGFLIYGLLFGAIGSMASKVEDINTTSMPLVFILIISIMVVSSSMTSSNIDSMLMKILSFIPLTSPFAMFTRIAMGNVSSIEIAVSILLLVISIGLLGVLCGKIYRACVLMYGLPPKFFKVIKMVLKSR